MTVNQEREIRKKAWFHVDMDGLNTIFKAHAYSYTGGEDQFYISAVENSLTFFAEQRIRATYFVIASDLEDRAKKKVIKSIVENGHHIASHSLNHLYLNQISQKEKEEEIFSSKKRIEDSLGVQCLGFRAPGYSIDYPSLELLAEAGYQYDSSAFPSYQFRTKLGIQRLYPEPFLMFPEHNFFEFPLPFVNSFLPPFHPSYIFYLTSWYFKFSLNTFIKQNNYLTLLFHLTDFAERQKVDLPFKLQIYTNNLFSEQKKQKLARKLIKEVRRNFDFTTSEEFVKEWPNSAPDLNPKTILGISTTHETGASIVRDQEILSAISEERLSRKKFDTKYPPVGAIREAIRMANIDPTEIEAVAIGGLHWRDLLPQTLASFWQDIRDFHSFNDYFPHFCRVLYRLFYFWRATRYKTVQNFLKKEYGITPKIFYIEHHEAHAASAYRTGNGHPALIITADGVGDDVCITFSIGKGSMIRRIGTYFYPNSFGQFYTACTQILGFKGGRHEGKITGLSGFGKPNPDLINRVRETFFGGNGEHFKLNKKYYAEGFIRIRKSSLKDFFQGQFDILSVDYRNYKMPLKKLLSGFKREDVAYAFQSILEEEMVRLARHFAGNNGRQYHLALAGGIFANVKLNMALSQSLKPESIYIFPNMGDGGLCVGAALNINAPQPAKIKNMYLGSHFEGGELEKALQKFSSLSVSEPDDMAREVAGLLAQEKIVARFSGKMEFGPRALGNRSILYHCGDRSVNDWLNKQLKRTEFMPFAPICIYEDARDYFEIRKGEYRPCEYMTLVVKCTQKMIETCPAAVHVDGTARPQLIREETNQEMYKILHEYNKLTGISCMINTSFNMHEEPIVRTPEEAIIAFQQSNLDYLILGHLLIRQGEISESRTNKTRQISIQGNT